MRLGHGMSGHGHASLGKGSNSHLGLGAVGTVWVRAACVAASCQPCASRGVEQGCSELGGWCFGPKAALWGRSAA